MSDLEDRGFLRDNWYLIMGLAAVVAGIVYFALANGADGPAPADATNEARVTREPEYATAARPGADDKALEIIREYEAELAEAPDEERRPQLLEAAGNLYKQKLGDYEAAAKKYQVLIIEHPDWEGIRRVYPQLEVAFRELEDEEGLIWLYRHMMEQLPPETQDYQYAEQQLRQMGKR